MKRYSVFIILLLTLVITISMVDAQPFNRGNEKFFHSPENMMGIPDLIPDQIKQIQKWDLEHQKEVLPLRSKIKVAELDMRSLIFEEADQKTIDKKIEEIGYLKIELAKKKNTHRMQIRNLLTDEQKTFFDSNHRLGKRHKGYDPFRMMGPGYDQEYPRRFMHKR